MTDLTHNDFQADELTYNERPTMFRANPFGFIFLCILIPVGVGAIGLGAWYLGVLSNRLVVDGHAVMMRRGLLAKHTKEILIRKIRLVEIDQTFLQRLTKCGTVRIYGTGDSPEIVMNALPRPYDIKTLITEYQMANAD